MQEQRKKGSAQTLIKICQTLARLILKHWKGIKEYDKKLSEFAA